MPQPWSLTLMAMRPSRARAETVIVEPGAEYFTALSKICTSACCTSTGSTWISGRSADRSLRTARSASRRRQRSIAELMMSDGSAHSMCGLMPSLEMRLASSRFWMSLLSRSASLRTSSASALSFFSLVERRRRAQHGGGAEDGGERRAQLVADRFDQRLAQLVGLRAHARLADGVGDVEPFERGGGVGQHGVDAAAQFADAFAVAALAVEIDGDDAELRVCGDTARTSQISPLSAVTVSSPVEALPADATSITLASTGFGTAIVARLAVAGRRRRRARRRTGRPCAA